MADVSQPLVSIKEAYKKLRSFSAMDYFATFAWAEDPYECVYQWSRNSLVLFQRYSEVLKAVAKEKQVDDDSVIRGLGKWHQKIYELYPTTEIDQMIRQELLRDTKDVTLLPLMCGLGKSTAISYLIRDVVEKNIVEGLLVVTDSVDRLDSYLHPSFDQELADDLQRYSDQITLLESSNKQEAMQRQRRTPVLLMTTQRYFSMTVEEINDLLQGEGFHRDYIIIDEKPLIKTVETVTRTDVNKVASAIFDGVHSYEDHEAKTQAMKFWETLRRTFERTVQRFEDDHMAETSFYATYVGMNHIADKTVSKYDIDEFREYIARRRVRDQLKHFDPETLVRTERILSLIWDGGIFYSSQGKYYRSCFYTSVNRWDRLSKANARVLILDGTGDVHPDYDCQDGLFSVKDDLPFRLLDNLSMHFVNIDTSKSKLSGGDFDGRWKDAVLQYLNSEGIDKSITPLFTYKDTEGWFKRKGYHITGHFGDIKGRNQYMGASCIVQVGMNLYNHQDYLTLWLGDHLDMLEQMVHLPHDQLNKELDALSKSEEVLLLRDRILLAELEQNMFRCSIRNARCIAPAHYYVICDVKRHRNLIEMAQQRYAKYGVFIDVDDQIPEVVLRMKRQQRRAKGPTKRTAYQRFMSWFEQAEVGRVMTKEELLAAAGLSQNDFQNLLRKVPGTDLYQFPDIKLLIDSMRIGRNRYMKK